MASAKQNAQAALKAKEAKQKKLLIVLAPVFLGLAVWQGPKMYKQLFSSAPPPEVAATTTAPTDPTLAPPPTAPTDGGTATPPGALPDTELPPEADVTKLIAFSRFTGRDPFVAPPGFGSTASEGGGTGGTGGSGGTGGTGGSAPPPAGSEAQTAVLKVNGETQTVSIGEEFPASDPVFTLVALTEDSATIGVVQGMFEGGEATVDIALEERVVLVAAPSSTRYTVELLEING
jgi:hypothetical protein